MFCPFLHLIGLLATDAFLGSGKEYVPNCNKREDEEDGEEVTKSTFTGNSGDVDDDTVIAEVRDKFKAVFTLGQVFSYINAL